MTDVPEGYFYDIEKNKRIGYPSGETLRKINKNTTRWKVKSLIRRQIHWGDLMNLDLLVTKKYVTQELINRVV